MSRTARLLCAVLLTACLSLGCVQLQLFGGLPKPLQETLISGTAGPKILMVKLDGVISRSAGSPGGLLESETDNLVSRVHEMLDRAREDAEVKALVLRIDSPGGSATASDLLYHEILRFKRESELPVVAHFLGTATSGGYYVAMASDHVVAEPTAVTGSIGVVYLAVNFAGLMEKIGVENQTLVAGRYKDAGSPLRSMREDERSHLQSILDDLHARFRAVVDEGRPALDPERVEELADGRVFSARQALDAGLIDQIGSLEDALEAAKQRAGLKEARVVTYHRSDEYENNLLTRALERPPRIEIALPTPFRWFERPGFYYLWHPGLGAAQ